jgi:hypothetical protein
MYLFTSYIAPILEDFCGRGMPIELFDGTHTTLAHNRKSVLCRTTKVVYNGATISLTERLAGGQRRAK